MTIRGIPGHYVWIDTCGGRHGSNEQLLRMLNSASRTKINRIEDQVGQILSVREPRGSVGGLARRWTWLCMVVGAAVVCVFVGFAITRDKPWPLAAVGRQPGVAAVISIPGPAKPMPVIATATQGRSDTETSDTGTSDTGGDAPAVASYRTASVVHASGGPRGVGRTRDGAVTAATGVRSSSDDSRPAKPPEERVGFAVPARAPAGGSAGVLPAAGLATLPAPIVTSPAATAPESMAEEREPTTSKTTATEDRRARQRALDAIRALRNQ